MGGNTGNIRTRRNQSGTVGYRTLGSVLASDGGAGAGSARRIYGWFARRQGGDGVFKSMFNINRGQFKSRAQNFIGRQMVM